MRGTLWVRTASSSASVPATLLEKYRAGCFTDSATSDLAAKCSTPSKAASPSTLDASMIEARTRVAPVGTASA